VFEAMPEQTKTRNRWVESRASDQLTVSVIPPELRKAVQESGKDQYWASTVIPVGTEDRPGIAVGNKVTFNGTVYELYLIYDLNSAQQTLDEIQSVLWAGGAVLVLLIGAVAWYVTRNVVSPVSHAAMVSEKLAASEPPGADYPARHPLPDAAALRFRRLARTADAAHHRPDGCRGPL
jgi:two-component system sensor histidine kinase MtrB